MIETLNLHRLSVEDTRKLARLFLPLVNASTCALHGREAKRICAYCLRVWCGRCQPHVCDCQPKER
jgi:hypothetical protein